MNPGDRIRVRGGSTIYTIETLSPAFIHATTEAWGGEHLLLRDGAEERFEIIETKDQQ